MLKNEFDEKTRHELAEILRNYRIIAIDGDSGVGKTTLAKYLRDELHCRLISLDSHIQSNQNSFINSFDINKLSKSIKDTINDKVIIEGVCLLHFLSLIEIGYDVLVYCRHISAFNGEWYDSISLNIDNPDEYQVEINKIKQDIKRLNLSNLKLEIIEYHYKYRPYEKCNYIFNKT
jgi:hypothetical protein